MTHRVEWTETDAAGIIHFSSYFRYMEVTEHAFFRSLGFSIASQNSPVKVGWPRVHVECDFKVPLKFEDEVEVHLLVRERKEKSITYDFIFRKINGAPAMEVARGSLTVVCVTRDETGKMKAVPIPDAIASKIEVAPVDE
jgi:YbgC/YbaW family acyl-CoA thioester hydrolase